MDFIHLVWEMIAKMYAEENLLLVVTAFGAPMYLTAALIQRRERVRRGKLVGTTLQLACVVSGIVALLSFISANQLTVTGEPVPSAAVAIAWCIYALGGVIVAFLVTGFVKNVRLM